jgi:hypothetical protein
VARERDKHAPESLEMRLVPCSCGLTFAVAKEYDQGGSGWNRFLVCPKCGKRHDPRNRLLHLGYQKERFWKVDGC